MKKLKYLGLAALAVAGLSLAACAGGSSSDTVNGVKLPASRVTVNANTPSWKADKSHQKTLTWFVDQEWWNTSFGSDLVTKQIAKDLNIKINFVIGNDAKLNTYFASGKLPDIITNDSMTNQIAQKANTWALPLQTLANKYDPYFNKVANSQTMDWYKLKDGLTYGYPNYSNSAADYSSGKIMPEEGFVIQKSIYDALGKPAMDTPADFVKVMTEIHQKYPSKITMGFTDLGTTVQDLLGVPYYQDGKLYDRNSDSDYLKWLEAIREVHAIGGISDDDFTSNAANNLTQNLSTGKYATAIIGSAINNAAPLQTWNAAHPDDQYIVVTAIKSTEGRKPDLSQAGISGWLSTYITKDCKDPESAIELFTYLLSDYGQMLVNYGIEGQTYTKQSNGTIKVNSDVLNLETSNNNAFKAKYNLGQFILFGHDKYKAMDPTDSYPAALTTFFDWGKGMLTPEFPSENVAPVQGTLQASNDLAITNQWATTNVALVRAASQSDFNSQEAQYQSFLKSHGWSDIQKTLNSQVQANLKKLGMPSNASTPNT